MLANYILKHRKIPMKPSNTDEHFRLINLIIKSPILTSNIILLNRKIP